MFQLLYYYKTYPTLRHFRVLFDDGTASAGDLRNLNRCIRRRTAFLAKRMARILPDAWTQRDGDANPASTYFPGSVIGAVDTFPIRCNRPKDRDWNTALYNGGKYKATIVKMQIVAGPDGRPIHISGPHIGVRSDLKIWKLWG